MKTLYDVMKSTTYKSKKAMRMMKIERTHKIRNVSSARDYLIIANSISGKDRIDSRKRIIQRGAKKRYADE